VLELQALKVVLLLESEDAFGVFLAPHILPDLDFNLVKPSVDLCQLVVDV